MSELHIRAVLDAIERAPGRGQRLLVGIAGPPGSGKSTLAAAVVERLNAGPPPAATAALVPMDGFHLDNAELDARGLRAVKGAPETFDAVGFVALVRHLREPGRDLRYPLFDRAADRTLPDAGRLHAGTEVVVVEGNYLLLADGDWADLAPLFDVTVMIAPPMDVLEARLVARWLGHGLPPDEARRRARGNDLVNARRVLDGSRNADLVLSDGAVVGRGDDRAGA
ncbi:uridine kinase [Rhodovulum sp. 12E13]|uniref:uridine kinase n=1 Tax=Rhodovulum sp. 12E13 TaxID=2203891 RepID=UPI0035110AD0